MHTNSQLYVDINLIINMYLYWIMYTHMYAFYKAQATGYAHGTNCKHMQQH